MDNNYNKKLTILENIFFARYPKGFESEQFKDIGKKHPIDKMHNLCNEYFAKDNFTNANTIIKNMSSIISKSSMVSLFEKPKFRDFVNILNADEAEQLSYGLYQMLYSNKQEGFEIIVEILQRDKLAKWTLVSSIPNFMFPHKEYLIKPTTTKNILNFFEIDYIKYTPKPNFEFYNKYTDFLNTLKENTHTSLHPSNAAFTGFLMISIEEAMSHE